MDPPRLMELQEELAELRPEPWSPQTGMEAGGCFVCFERGGEGPGAVGDRAWAAAAVVAWRRMVAGVAVDGQAGAPYHPGLLAAREGALLEKAVRALDRRPDLLLVNATGRDHPRRAGMALHLGWVLDLPTVGVTHRPLVATGSWPGEAAGDTSPLTIDGETVGAWIRPRPGVRPVAVSPGWRTSLEVAIETVVAALVRSRTPEPLRQARRLARTARTEQTRVRDQDHPD